MTDACTSASPSAPRPAPAPTPVCSIAPGGKACIAPPAAPADYFTYQRPPSRGRITPLINGRNSNGSGPDIDSTEPLDAMQAAVQALVSGDFLILALPAATRDNLKYIVCRHPAHVGSLKGLFAGKGFNEIYVASHHQKFMVVRHGSEWTAFCGGVDIESRKVPANWSYGGLIAWHDIHVMLEGPITHDLETEFVMRWNLDHAASRRAPLAGWSGYEVLALTPPSGSDSTAAKTQHDVQMLRTVSRDGGSMSPFETTRDDIQQAYRTGVSAATRFVYMENQYFRSPDLARWIVAQGKAQPSLIVIVVVVANAGNDDGANAVTRHGDFLQFAFFDSIVSALGAARVRIYTMVQRAVHAKFVLVDDAWMCIGSANANVRSFQLDTELNVQTGAGALVNSFRTRLWAWNLGQTAATVASWPVSDFLAQWDSVAKANAAVSAPRDMVGEGVVGFDYKTAPGKRSLLIPDAFAQLDVSFEPSLFAGDDGGGSGTDGGDGANTANSTAPA